MILKYFTLIVVTVSVLILIIIGNQYRIREPFEQKQPNIVGYFHIAQMPNWERSYDTIMPYLLDSKLINHTSELRLGVLTESSKEVDSSRLNYPNMRIVYIGNVKEYERPTLMHMKYSAEKDPPGTLYYYIHTKGISHYGRPSESTVMNWFRYLLRCNISHWKNAVDKLRTYETYGCDYNNTHYSGNIWWATAEHIKKLPDTIPPHYTGPEDYILINKDNVYCANNCGDAFIPTFDETYFSTLQVQYNNDNNLL